MTVLTITNSVSLWNQQLDRFEVLQAPSYPATFEVEQVMNLRTGKRTFFQIVGTTCGIDQEALSFIPQATIS